MCSQSRFKLLTNLFLFIVIYRPEAQLAEHRSPKPGVGGSSPSGPAIFLTNVPTNFPANIAEVIELS